MPEQPFNIDSIPVDASSEKTEVSPEFDRVRARSQSNRYLNAARNAVVEATPEIGELQVDDLYIVWFAKTLRNWKALVSTDLISGAYWEVTYDGEKFQTYVDLYVKEKNTVLLEKPLASK